VLAARCTKTLIVSSFKIASDGVANGDSGEANPEPVEQLASAGLLAVIISVNVVLPQSLFSRLYNGCCPLSFPQS
jgi:hypothetical protein